MSHAPFRRSRANLEAKSYDPYHYAQTVIDANHRLVHDGMFYSHTGKDESWTNGATRNFYLSVPAGVFPHIQVMKLDFGRGDIDFVAYEGTTVSSSGTPLTAVNVNRASANTPSLSLSAEPTVTDTGTAIFTLWAPPTSTGTGQSANGVEGVGQGSEWILNAGTNYLVRLTNNSGSTISWAHEFTWYEIDYS